MVELSYLTRRFDLPTNRLYRIRENLLRKGEKIVDFVSGNVNAQGLHFPPRPLQRALIAAARKTKLYRPDPLGQQEAREAISRYYAAEARRVQFICLSESR